MDFEITRYEIPVPETMIKQISEMWLKVPEEVGVVTNMAPRPMRPPRWVTRLSDDLTNRVRAEDRKLLYVARVDGEVAGPRPPPSSGGAASGKRYSTSP